MSDDHPKRESLTLRELAKELENVMNKPEAYVPDVVLDKIPAIHV